jgi:hypothetical protein
MAEYIEREALRERMESVDWFHVNDTGVLIHGATSEMDSYLPTKEVHAVIENAPAADVVPVAQSTWEVVHGVFTPGGDPLLRCPICKARESEHLCGVECRTVWHYCPVCGAHLKEGGAE